MGTRADFYIGRGMDAEWIGSIAWDGYPSGIDDSVLDAKNSEAFREAVTAFLADRKDATTPDMGWPWPWETSKTTDFAYAIDGDRVHASSFGCNWFEPKIEDDNGEHEEGPDAAVFPDMSGRKNVQIGGSRSGIILIG